MGFSLVCPACGASFENVPDSVIGKKVKCKNCASLFVVRTEGSAASPPAASKKAAPRTARKAGTPKTNPRPSRPTVSTRSTDWRVGDVILNLYEVTGILGEGGMGTVYKVLHRGWGLELAVKSPKAHVLAKAGGAENFEREAETWVNLGLHPHTVSCYYVRRVDEVPGFSPNMWRVVVWPNGSRKKSFIEAGRSAVFSACWMWPFSLPGGLTIPMNRASYIRTSNRPT